MTKRADCPLFANKVGVVLAVASSNMEEHGCDKNGEEIRVFSLCSRVDDCMKWRDTLWARYRTVLTQISWLLLLLAYLVYFIYAMVISSVEEDSDLQILVIFTVLGFLLLGLNFTWGHITEVVKFFMPNLPSPVAKAFRKALPQILYVVNSVMMATLLLALVALDSPSNLISLAGLAAFVLLCWLFSVNRARVNWHPVFWGMSLQFYFAAIILKTKAGYDCFKWLGEWVAIFLSYSSEGAAFVFGPAPVSKHFFAFTLMPMMVFFSATISVLYHLGVMQAVVAVLGRFLAFCLSTTPAESINTAANIFVGMLEAPLIIRPFLDQMTKSELHAVMTGGFATIAGTVLGAYIGFGIPANHLLSASVMSAPAALAVSKLTYPETEQPHCSSDDYRKMEVSSSNNLISAVSEGASNVIDMVSGILVNVIAFLSILKFVNTVLSWLGERVGVEGLTFEFICSYVLYPVALFMGTEPGLDCRRIGELLGVKTFTNEFIAYQNLRKLLLNRNDFINYTKHYNISTPGFIVYDDLDVILVPLNVTLKKGFLSRRSEVIATYALCGFSSFGSMGILLGGLSAVVPHRRHDLSSLVFRAMVAGNTACFFTACIAGLFFQEFD